MFFSWKIVLDQGSDCSISYQICMRLRSNESAATPDCLLRRQCARKRQCPWQVQLKLETWDCPDIMPSKIWRLLLPWRMRARTPSFSSRRHTKNARFEANIVKGRGRNSRHRKSNRVTEASPVSCHNRFPH